MQSNLPICILFLLSFHVDGDANVIRDYKTALGRIIAVNLAHDEKRQGTKTHRVNAQGKIEKYNEAHHVTGLFQGDIILDPELEKLIHPKNHRVKRNALRWRKRLWTSRIIPFVVAPFMEHVRPNFQAAINEIHKYTCIRFVPYEYFLHNNYIYITNTNGCSSKVGKKYFERGSQIVSLGSGCNFVSTILHELLHTIGFFHEQSRNDRDKYVKILWENILDGFQDQFDKYDWQDINDLGKDYDFKSIMHYDRRAFTKNGKATIEAIHDPDLDFGTKNGILSTRDIIEIDALYDCKATTSYGWASWSSFTPCDENCFRYRERYCYNSGNLQSCGDSSVSIHNVYGVDRQKVKCDSSRCPAPIDGHWGRWSSWASCSVSCNEGIKKRYRKCDNPYPMHGGASCPGSGVEEDVCVTKRCHLDYDDTDFEAGMGMWRNKFQNVLNWKRHTGFTQTANTGPNSDHTSGAGYYLYMESSAPAKAGDVANLESSAWLPSKSGGQCLKFQYHMHGNTMGALAVKIQWSEGDLSYFLFYKSGDQGQNWIQGTGNIDPPSAGQKYQLTFVGKVGDTGYSDIAIDDVYIDDGLCSCQDKFVNCAQWTASADCGSSWMQQSCKKSCKVCTAGLTACTDSSATCADWASRGECDSNPSYMLIKCQKSCHSCACKDKNSGCPGWASIGECDKNPLYMLNNCQKSCNACACKDEDPAQCPPWAAAGYCQSNSAYMDVNCRKSCGIC